jgi:hypothetical protein
MTELQVEEFARRAVSAVELPDLAEIAARGRRRRRRRWTVAAATTTVVALGGYLAVVDGDPDVRPVEDPESEVRHYPGGSELPRLAPGTYELELGRESSPGAARFTVPEGWNGWFGPNRPYLRHGYAGLLVGDVDRVAEAACGGPVSPMREVGDETGALVAALEELPRHELVAPPAAVTFAGLPATHLTLRGSGSTRCEGGVFELWDSPGSGGLIQAAPPRSTVEAWVVALAGEAVLVTATSSPRTPARVLEELDRVVDSVELRAEG